MRRAGALAVLVLMCGCAAEEPDASSATPAAPASEQSASSATGQEESLLVGAWRRTTTCEERVQALEDAGLGRFAAEHAAGEGWIPGVASVDELADPAHPCEGAVPLDHDHFFTASGQFGSRDADGTQVDDGTYEVTDPQTVVISKEFGDVAFRFDVTDDELNLRPELPDCAAEGCFAAQWAVAVSYDGLPWERVA